MACPAPAVLTERCHEPSALTFWVGARCTGRGLTQAAGHVPVGRRAPHMGWHTAEGTAWDAPCQGVRGNANVRLVNHRDLLSASKTLTQSHVNRSPFLALIIEARTPDALSGALCDL